jgi:hypothetical protein
MFFHRIDKRKSNAFGKHVHHTFQDLMTLLDQVKDAIVEEEGEASDTLTCSLNHDFVQEKTNNESTNSLNAVSKQKCLDSSPCETYLVLEVTLFFSF